ncbi:MAG: hypothetical protein DRI90_04090 [Deltaproteobacteria bacterium]|nr:MAG: hypothetical protein DRI90_04090 [Deltaproteobacteria bacterium]
MVKQTMDEQIAPAAATAVGLVVGIGPGTGSPPVGPAPGDRHMWIEIDDVRVRAMLAVPAPYQPTIGDRVVLVGHGDGRYVVGVVEQQAPAALALKDGGRAELCEDGALEVRDDVGRLRVRYDGDSATIVADRGDLALEAPNGGVVMRARDDVVVEAGRDIEQRATGVLRQAASRIDVRAEQLFEKTRDSVRETSALLLTRAGRVRTLVREGYSLLSRRTHIKSEKDTSIDGERVLLG